MTAARTKAEVRPHGGVPTLFVTGQPVPAAAYMTYYTDRNRYADFAAAGYRLYSVPVFFAERTINESSQFPPFKAGLFDGDEPDYTVFDRDIRAVLEACPDALIFPRVNLSLPVQWELDNPDECCDTAVGTRRCFCFASEAWAAETERLLTLFLRHAEAAPFADRIVGYQLACGNTEEWFSFDFKGSVGRRAHEAFRARGGGDETAFFRMLSEITASRICRFAHTVKELTGGRAVVGAFYGYTLECPHRESCHHDMKTVLDCPDIDFICSPVSYGWGRPAGIDHANMTCVDSIKLHGKLYFAENDTRTHLSRPPCNLPYFQNPIWTGPAPEVTSELLKMHFARALTHGHGFWWFDMWGGWYACETYMTLLAKLRRLAEAFADKPRASAARTAVFADEVGLAAAPADAGAVLYSFRRTLGLCGVPYDIYLAEDYPLIQKQYDAVILLSPADTPALAAIRAARPDAIVIDGSNAAMSPTDLRRALTSRGIVPYVDRDCVVYENESFLFLHTSDAGMPVLTLPFAVEEVFGREPEDGAGKSCLFIKKM